MLSSILFGMIKLSAMDEAGRLLDRFRGCLLGVAVGDALGASVEGMSGEDIRRCYGVLRDMKGGGWLGLAPGQYTDDAAMMLCIARSIVERKRFDPQDVAQKFVAWLDSGAVGIGRTTFIALTQIKQGAPWDQAGERAREMLGELAAGNGSIMRCAPIGLLDYDDIPRLIQDSLDSSRITHSDPRACWSTVAVNLLISRLVRGERENLLNYILSYIKEAAVSRVLYGAAELGRGQLVPSGFVLDTLKCALWAFLSTSSFEEALVEAVNLGGDADTIGAVTGALAGAAYGAGAIPWRWLEKLQDRDEIIHLATEIWELAYKSTTPGL